MPITQQTSSQTEADLESKISETVVRAFPWLPPGSVQHQTKFSFTFGRTKVEVDGLTASRHEARTDILLHQGARALAVLELKRPGQALTPADIAQGLSYARMLHPCPPIVVVTNGVTTELYESYSGARWSPAHPSGEAVEALFRAASQLAAADLKDALNILLGPNSEVWAKAIRSASHATIAEMTGDLTDSQLPFAQDFLIPRSATDDALDAVLRSSLVIVEGPPLIGKSNVLRSMVEKTEASDTIACLYLEAEPGSGGILQRLANLLADALGWDVSKDEVRQWLRKLSLAQGPNLVILLDGVGTDRDQIYSELQELSSGFGVKLRIVLGVDDTVADLLVRSTNSRKASGIGRRAQRIRVDSLSDTEFENVDQLLWDRKLALMKGGNVLEEYRSPWVLRAAVATAEPATPNMPPDGAVTLIPSLLGPEVIQHARMRFKEETELTRQFRGLALAVLSDVSSEHRSADSVLFSLLAFVASRDAVEEHLDREDIDSLRDQGILRQIRDSSGESLFLLRISGLVAAELATEMANQIISRIVAGENPAEWLAKTSRLLPLGDVIGAQAFMDAALRRNGFPANILEWFLNHPPTRKPVVEGASGLAVFPEVGQVSIHFKGGGMVEITGNGHSVNVSVSDGDFRCVEDVENWLILSHIARHKVVAYSEDGELFGRIDPAILLEVGSSPHVLRRIGSNAYSHHLLHDIEGYGKIVCDRAGFIEPILIAIYEFLSSEGQDANSWIETAVRLNSLPLVHRIGMVLRLLESSTNNELAQWSAKMLKDVMEPAFSAFPPFRHD